MPGKFLIDQLTDFRIMLQYSGLGPEPPEFDLIRNDAEHRHRGAHTLDRHGPGIPLQRMAGAKTIEGRIYGDPPWRSSVTRSYQWTDLPTLHDVVNTYVRQHWEVIRVDLARHRRHNGTAGAGRLIGQGYESNAKVGTATKRAHYREISQFKVCIRLAQEVDQAVPFILSAFPWSSLAKSPG